MKCSTYLCQRKVTEGMAVCDGCLARILHGAFGPEPAPVPQSWHARARAHVGRAYAVGGIDTGIRPAA